MEKFPNQIKKVESHENLPGSLKAKKLLETAFANGKIKDVTTVSNIIRDMLTTRSDYITGIEQKPGGISEALKTAFAPQKEWYKKTIDQIQEKIKQDKEFSWESSPAWFGIDTVPKDGKHGQMNYKTYTTIPFKQYTYIKDILSLAKKLKELAIKSNDLISVKVPTGLSGFLAHNDSLVVHFKKENNKDEIFKILNEWMQEHGITEQERQMERTKFAADSKETSFSDLVAQNTANWLKENADKYPSEALMDLAIKNAIKLSQVPPKVKSAEGND